MINIGPYINRFWLKVQLSKPCWLWIGGKNKNGYGDFRSCPVRAAHRFSYLLHFSEIPNGMCVLHTCDNPACVNPGHLFLGTQVHNRQDCIEKGRQNAQRGEDRWSAKLSYSKSDAIRRMYMAGTVTMRELAGRYGVGVAAIHSVVHHKTWNPSKCARKKSKAKPTNAP